ncbi:MAG TPA: hypothetical protein VJP77_04040, partial [Planctomycetota bacterium]|nr:hypothetical protein [Planctomycetota bacterium]
MLARRALLAATLVASLGPSATGQVAVPCASQVLEPDGLGAQDQLGSAVALEAGTLVVGAPLDDGAGTSAGTLFAWKRTDAGTFELVGELAPDALAAGDQLGRAVAASGNRVL